MTGDDFKGLRKLQQVVENLFATGAVMYGGDRSLRESAVCRADLQPVGENAGIVKTNRRTSRERFAKNYADAGAIPTWTTRA